MRRINKDRASFGLGVAIGLAGIYFANIAIVFSGIGLMLLVGLDIIWVYAKANINLAKYEYSPRYETISVFTIRNRPPLVSIPEDFL
jgi:hypothetical protein